MRGSSGTRGAFSMLELVVVVAIMGLFSGAVWSMFRGSVRGLETAGDHQVALRNALVLTTALDQDLRAVAVLNQRREYTQAYPLSPYSIVFSPARTSVRMRVSAPIESLEADPASRFIIVTYQLVEARDRKGCFMLRRDEKTASGERLPGERSATRSHTFEELTLSGLRFRFVAWLAPLEWRQHITLHLSATEGQTPEGDPRTRSITRQFEVPVPAPPHGSAGGPRGFALDFPPSALAGKLSGGVDIVGRPGNVEPLEVPPDALDRRGQPITLPPEAPAGGVSDPFARLEIPVPPLRGLFLHAALDRLEAALGAGYRGAICGMLTGTAPIVYSSRMPGGGSDDLRFRLDASESTARPLIRQLDELFEKAKARGPSSIVQLAQRLQMDAIPPTDKPLLEAARLLVEERKVGELMRRLEPLLTLVAALALTSPARAEWPHYLGPQFDNVSREKDVTAGSVKKLWTAEVGTGFASVTIAGGRAYTMGNNGTQDLVIALDAVTGADVWKHGYPAPIEARSYEGGPNATPTVAGGRVYALGRQGRMLCLDAGTGAVVWDKSAAAFNAEPPTWGFSSAPTVVGPAVVYNCGSRGIALHKDTGATLWGTGGSGAGYATAIPYAAGGVKDSAVALFNSAGLHALDIQTGAPVWSFPWNTSFEVNAASPTPVENGFFISTGYDTGCAMVDASGPQPSQTWRNRAICSHFNTCAYLDGYIFGIDGNAGRRCNMVCVNASDGAVVWKKETGFGTLRLVEKTLFFLSEPGMLFVVKADPAAYQELAKHRVIEGKCWTAPTISDKKLYVRNADGKLVCYELEGGALTVEPLLLDKDVNLSY